MQPSFRLHRPTAIALLTVGLTMAFVTRTLARQDTRTAATGMDGTWVQFPPATRPGAVSGAGFVYDAPRGRFIRFGGRYGATKLNDLWTATATGPVRWSVLAASGTPPGPRFGHTMVYDSARDRLLVFGGTLDGTTGLNEVWELTLGTNPPAWNLLTVSGSIPGRYFHVGVYDPVGDRLVVFGGISSGVRMNDTWQLSLAGTPTWSAIPIGGPIPSARNLACAVYDSAGARMVMFGGDQVLPGPVVSATNDTWALSLGPSPAWNPIAPGGPSPVPCDGCSAIYDPARQRMVMIGGAPNEFGVYALGLGASPGWSAVPTLGVIPSARSQACLAYDPVQDRAVLYSGLGGASESNDGFALSLAGVPRWGYFEPSPLARLGSAGAYDAARHRLVMFGGTEYKFQGPTKVNDTWTTLLDNQNQWTPLVTPTAPAVRSDALLVADASRDRLILFAGVGDQFYNDLWAFDLGTQSWTQLTTPTRPAGRLATAGIFDAARDRIIVFGGLNGQIANNETWQLDFSPSPHWTLLAPAGTPPSPRYGHSLVYDATRDRVLVFGGASGAGVPNGETWSLNLSGPMAWTQVLPTGTAPGPLYAHNAIYDPVRDRMVVYGGYNGNASGTAYALDLSSPSPNWLVLHPNGALPLARLAAVGIYDPVADRFVVTGGNAYAIPPGGDTWALSWGDIPTPTLLSFVDCEAAADHVRLRWQASDAADLRAAVERSSDGSGWTTVGVPLLEGTSLLVYDDGDVTAGRYWYRLAYAEGSLQRYSDPVSVVVPAGVALALAGARPNPAAAGSAIEFQLPDARPTRLELVDVRGRLIWSHEVGTLGVGAHSVPLSEAGALGAGVYWVRLVRPGVALTRKTVVLAP